MGASSRAVVLIGSGPSLNRIDPRRLGGLRAIAFNRSYLAWPDWGFAPTYHACLDPRSMAIVGPDLAAVVRAHPQTRFFLHRNASEFGIAESDRVTLSQLAPAVSFATSLTRLTDLGNVGAISLQVLALLGYRRVLMVGVDGNYAPDRDPDRDPNHFRDDYATGRRPLTDDDRRYYTAGWPSAAAECKRLGLDVRNASPGTILSCFDAIEFEDGLAWVAQRSSREADLQS